MLLTKKVIVKWHPRNKDYYEELGYKYTKHLDEFEVKIEDLKINSHAKVKIKCDYNEEGCRNIYEKSYSDYIKNNKKSIIHKDCCNNPNCMKIKREESVLKTYNVSNINKLDAVQQKREETCYQKYGSKTPLLNQAIIDKSKETLKKKYNVTNISQVEKIKNKKVKTFRKRYGTDNPLQNEYIKNKSKKTCLEKYGVENYTQTEEYKIKTRKTHMKKYGVTHLMKIPNVVEKRIPKMVKTKYRNGTGQSSRQQDYIANLINGEINYPVNNLMLDIVIDDNIYIEYDGSGHNLSIEFGDITKEEFNKKEINRKYFLINKGWKEIRIISKQDLLPSDDKIKEMIEYAKQYISTGHTWIKFDIDNSKVICSQYEKDYNFGELRRISESDLKQFDIAN